ncbi:MAG: hypothetical protein HEQ39_10035 [Rhizobacter sp.]
MDQLDINAAALNGAGQSGATARSAVDGRVSFLMFGGGRVISRNRTEGEIRVGLIGGGRVIARNATDARVAISSPGSRASVSRRSVVDGSVQMTGVARATVNVRAPNTHTAGLTGVAKGSVTRRAPVTATTEITGTAIARVFRRSPVAAVAEFRGESIGTIIPRREVRSLVNCEFGFGGSAVLRGLIRLTIDGRVQFRLDGSGGGIGNQFPFDEPAPPERRFTAPQRPQTFEVTEMPLVGTATQQPGDIYDYDIDFAPWFPPGDNIISANVTVSPAMPVAPSSAINGLQVKVWVYDGGTSGLTYKLTLLAITSDGRQKEVELQVKIKEE